MPMPKQMQQFQLASQKVMYCQNSRLRAKAPNIPAFPSQTGTAANDSVISPCSLYLYSEDMEETSKALSFQSFISGDSVSHCFPSLLSLSNTEFLHHFRNHSNTGYCFPKPLKRCVNLVMLNKPS